MAAGGAGVVVLDFCSGKGLVAHCSPRRAGCSPTCAGATLLSFVLPQGRIVMLDANGETLLLAPTSYPIP
eukprot:scaffold56495_cov96-Phaeocystis_antarctica.AAC.1